MNNYLPLLVQNESFSQPLSLQPLTPGDTLRREGGREGEPFPRNPPPIYISRGNLNPPFRNSYNNSTIPPPPPPPLPFHAWKPGRAMFISLFFFSFSLSLLFPSPSLSVPLPSRASRTRRTPDVGIPLVTTKPPPCPPPPCPATTTPLPRFAHEGSHHHRTS